MPRRHISGERGLPQYGVSPRMSSAHSPVSHFLNGACISPHETEGREPSLASSRPHWTHGAEHGFRPLRESNLKRRGSRPFWKKPPGRPGASRFRDPIRQPIPIAVPRPRVKNEWTATCPFPETAGCCLCYSLVAPALLSGSATGASPSPVFRILLPRVSTTI